MHHRLNFIPDQSFLSILTRLFVSTLKFLLVAKTRIVLTAVYPSYSPDSSGKSYKPPMLYFFNSLNKGEQW